MSRTRITLKREWDGQVSQDAGYQFVLAYMISELRLLPFESWKKEYLDECLEARFFGEYAELHIFREDDTWMEVNVKDLADASESGEKGQDAEAASLEEVKNYAFVDRAYDIRGNCKGELPKNPEGKEFKKIVVREYIDYDDDGQAYTVKTRLVGLL